ncbi:AfsR/SARP family transcriptional regulator [Nonomuraea gerenzanensis]|uniref:Transcriptional regulator, SARP family n=1 Tax=Nonomuraea gerenzanensis TaxID=93944 RepID=A0A1M4DW32_9ACTN|nr:BTAD domain-containing putative transcriptional regulator [Nonomuraea gerenzanensis]SBO90776.1 transcriptional regulator, SARP family [Nonomuraea gerenzanensis]
MRQSLTVLLLGSPELSVGGTPVGVRSAKARALLCYLAATAAPRPRAELAALLWGERPDANARGSLRLALSELRKEVGGWLDVTREHVRLRAADACFVDRRHLAQAPTVAEALRLWRGNFMDGVSFCDAPAFAEWLECERRGVRLLLREVLRGARDEPAEQVVRLAYIVAGLDPYDEEAHRLLMTALARAGNRAGALACYDELRRRLAAELGVEPAPETRAVRERLAPLPAPEPHAARHRPAPPPAPETHAARHRPAATRRAPVPVPAAALIGRDAEVERLRALLGRERLVTLLGPGGIGKTRLAIAAATPPPLPAPATPLPLPIPAPETAFVSFAGVRPEAAVTTLARHLDVDLSPPRPALGLLLSAMSTRPRPLLLVLDNLEHLPSFDPVIKELLHTAPALRILTTSRRRPDLPGQVTITVEGLSTPAAEALFTARALTACPGFDSDREAPLVATICAATRGLPLAIELAAGLLRAVPCAALARHLDADLGLLAIPGPATRSRHACMRTVFETSWRLLDETARRTLAALSVFGGGCTLDTAIEVARTTPDVLVRLVDHSMIQLTPSGRYAIHPLIRQYAAAHLTPDERRAAHDRHADHFGRLLERHAAALQDASDTEVTCVLGAELDNIRAAWTASGRPRFLELYWTLCLRLRLYEESAAVLRRHLARTEEEPRLRARHLWMAGTSEHHLAREHEATRLARAALETLGEPLPESRRGLALATLAAAARQLVHRLLPPRPAPEDREAAQALTMLARLAYHQQDLPTMLAASLRQLNAAERASATGRTHTTGQAGTARRAQATGQAHATDHTPATQQADDAALLAEAYANAATIARVAGRHRLATRYGTLADQALATAQPPTEPAHRARLARGLDHLYTGAFEAASRSFAECRARTLAPRVAENCSGLLAETALWQGRFEAAATLFAATADLAAGRLGGDDLARHWCLTGQAEALLRLDPPPPDHIRQVLTAARASTERRRAQEKQRGLRDGPTMRTIQDMRLLTATARLHILDRGNERNDDARQVLMEVLTLAGRLPSRHRGMLECWSGLADLLWSLDPWPDRATTRLLHTHLTRYATRNPGAAARLGWARALVLTAAGRRAAAREAAEHALTTATRLSAPYDRRRAETILRHLRSTR